MSYRYCSQQNIAYSKGGEPAGHMQLAEVLNVARVRTLLSVQQTGRVENGKIFLKLILIQIHAVFVA